MNLQFNISISLFIIWLSILGCNKEIDNIPPSKSSIHYLKSDLGGCYNKTMENIEFGEEKNDTTIISLSNDTLKISVGINHICCTPFISNCRTINDSIFISISDTCPSPDNCYCRCYCYYTFDYFFSRTSNNQYYWQVMLNTQGEEYGTVFDKGSI